MLISWLLCSPVLIAPPLAGVAATTASHLDSPTRPHHLRPAPPYVRDSHDTSTSGARIVAIVHVTAPYCTRRRHHHSTLPIRRPVTYTCMHVHDDHKMSTSSAHSMAIVHAPAIFMSGSRRALVCGPSQTPHVQRVCVGGRAGASRARPTAYAYTCTRIDH
jgi:hypothetical protein